MESSTEQTRISSAGATRLGYVSDTYLKAWRQEADAVAWLEKREPRKYGSAWDCWWSCLYVMRSEVAASVETVRNLGGLLMLVPEVRE